MALMLQLFKMKHSFIKMMLSGCIIVLPQVLHHLKEIRQENYLCPFLPVGNELRDNCLKGLRLCSGSINYPIKYNLFYIERTGNTNRIHYDINLHNSNKLNIEDPVDIYRIKYENGAKKIKLSWFEKTFAYGIQMLSVTPDQAVFQFVSYNKRNFILRMNNMGVFRVLTHSLGRQIEVKRLFIHITGGSILMPKISKIELYGQDCVTGKETLEIIPV